MSEAYEDLRRPGLWLVAITAAQLVLLCARCSCGTPSDRDGGGRDAWGRFDAGEPRKGDAGDDGQMPEKDSGPPADPCMIVAGTWTVQVALVPSSTASNCVSQLPATVESVGDLGELAMAAAPPCNPSCACMMSGPNEACETAWTQTCASTLLGLHLRSPTRVEGVYRQTRIFTGLTCDWDVLISAP